MDGLNKLKKDLDRFQEKLVKELVEAQRQTAKKIEIDAQQLAPYKTGKYSDSIKMRETKVNKRHISTKVNTQLLTPVAKSTGKQYVLGFLLETGTLPHDIPNAFGFGKEFGIGGRFDGKFHPGFVSMPHFIPALNMNKTYYERNIEKAIERAIK